MDEVAGAVLSVAPLWNVLFDALLDARQELTERIRIAIQARVPSYRDIPRESLDDEIGFEIERVLRSARAGTPAITDGEFAELAKIGTARAKQGVPVDDMLHAWRIGVEVLVTHARWAGRQLGIDDALVLELVSSTLAATDLAMVTTADARRKAGRTLVLAEAQPVSDLKSRTRQRVWRKRTGSERGFDVSQLTPTDVVKPPIGPTSAAHTGKHPTPAVTYFRQRKYRPAQVS